MRRAAYAPSESMKMSENVEIYLDESLKKWDTVYPAAGNANSAVRLELDELEKLVNARKWVDVCK